MDDLFDDLPQRARGVATGRRAAATLPVAGRRVLDAPDNQDAQARLEAAGDQSARRQERPAGISTASSFGEGRSTGPSVVRAHGIRDGAESDAGDNSWDEDQHEPAAAVLRPQAAPVPPKAAPAIASATGVGVAKARTMFDDDDEDGGVGGGERGDAAGAKVAFKGVSRRKQAQLQAAAGVAQQQSAKYAVEKELVLDELQEITDMGREDITLQVADAPKVHRSKQVQSLEELEDEGLGRLKRHMQGSTQQGIDLTPLTACLLPEHLVVEPDEFWDKDLLLTQVASELQKEQEAREALMDSAAVR